MSDPTQEPMQLLHARVLALALDCHTIAEERSVSAVSMADELRVGDRDWRLQTTVQDGVARITGKPRRKEGDEDEDERPTWFPFSFDVPYRDANEFDYTLPVAWLLRLREEAPHAR